jgi:hypothetical protein
MIMACFHISPRYLKDFLIFAMDRVFQNEGYISDLCPVHLL